MKFLCVPCDSPMQMLKAGAPEQGSMAVEYECPECFHSMAMLTNPMETQMVSSLGVQLGPSGAGGRMADAARGGEGGGGPGEPEAPREGSGCPFAGVVDQAAAEAGDGLPWTPTAEQRLQNIPSFVRGMARKGIDKYAREKGRQQVDDALLDEAKDFFGM